MHKLKYRRLIHILFYLILDTMENSNPKEKPSDIAPPASEVIPEGEELQKDL